MLGYTSERQLLPDPSVFCKHQQRAELGGQKANQIYAGNLAKRPVEGNPKSSNACHADTQTFYVSPGHSDRCFEKYIKKIDASGKVFGGRP